MINLNKRNLSKKELLQDIPDIEIFKNYAPDLELVIGKRQLSPLRKENNASFSLFSNKDEVYFNDFVLGGGDCIRFVELLYKETFFDAMSRIVIDFGLTDKYIYRNVNANKKASLINIDRDELLKNAQGAHIQIKRRKWNKHDMYFWSPFGIKLKTLKKYNVVPLSHLFVSDNIITCDTNTYAFIETKDENETYKIYQPKKIDYKWINNHDESVWQGWSQLPLEGREVIITKSLKDVMTIDSLTGIPAVSLQAESVQPKNHIIAELKKRFDIVWIWYDNDFDSETNWGREYAAKIAEEHKLIQIEIPDKYEIKDPSDFCKRKGAEATKKLITTLTEMPF